MARLTNKKLISLSKGFKLGGFVAFSNIEDRARFRKILEKKGFKTISGKSSGPTINNPKRRIINAFALKIVEKKRRLK